MWPCVDMTSQPSSPHASANRRALNSAAMTMAAKWPVCSVMKGQWAASGAAVNEAGREGDGVAARPVALTMAV